MALKVLENILKEIHACNSYGPRKNIRKKYTFVALIVFEKYF